MSAEAGYSADLAIEAAREEAAYSLGVQAYLWGKPLLDYGHAVPAAIRVGGGKLNRFCQTAIPGTNSAGRTLDTCGFWDVRAGPVCVIVPQQTNGRGYIVQFADMFGTFFHVLGGQRGPQPGLYIITGPDDNAMLPPNGLRLKARTRMGMCVVRLFTGGDADGFRMMPLSVYTGRPASATALAPYDCDAPQNLLALDRIGYWTRMAFPDSVDNHDTLLASFRLIGLSATHGFRWRTLDDTVRRGVARAIRQGEEMVNAGRDGPPSQMEAGFGQWQAALAGYRLSRQLPECETRGSRGVTC